MPQLKRLANFRQFMKPRKRRIIGLAMVILLAALVIIAIVLHMSHHPNLNNVEVIKHDVSRHFVLPTDEQPALATITDRRKLSNDFFKQAQDGDKVLIYQKNQIAIIYRPSIDRIIAVGPVSIDTPPSGVPAGGK